MYVGSIFCFVYYLNIITYSWCLGEKGQTIKNVTLGPSNIFDLLNIRPFSPGGLWTFLVDLAHGEAGVKMVAGKLATVFSVLRNPMDAHIVMKA